MGSSYKQLTLEERCTIAELQRAGRSNGQIAAALDRSTSTIGRELKRNGAPKAGYRPAKAQDKAAARRWSGSRLERNHALRERVLDDLAAGCSPAQVAGRLKREAGGGAIVSAETIYRFVYDQQKRTNDGKWRNYLPQAKFRRGRRGQKGGSSKSLIKQRVDVHQRPQAALDRAQPGHWEADFMLFSRYGQNVLVLHERTSRFTLLIKTANRKAAPTADTLAKLLQRLPKRLRRTLTFDNGTEFAEHHRLNADPGLKTYFCDPHSPWQKGGVENAIGRVRRFLPRKTNLDTIDPDSVLRAAQRYNHVPRKCLDFQTPAEVFSKLLHFKRDSTSRHSAG